MTLPRLLWCEAVYYDASTTMSEAVRTMMRMDAEAAQESATQADAGFLWDFWYPAVRSAEIRGHKLVTAMLLEVPLVLGTGWESGGVLLSRMAVRCLLGTVLGDSFAFEPG